MTDRRERASIRIEVTNLGHGIRDLSLAFEDLPPEHITDEMRQAVLEAMATLTKLFLATKESE